MPGGCREGRWEEWTLNLSQLLLLETKWPLLQLPRSFPAAPWIQLSDPGELITKSAWVFTLFVPHLITVLNWQSMEVNVGEEDHHSTHECVRLLWWEWYYSVREVNGFSWGLPAWAAASNWTPRCSPPGHTPQRSCFKKGLQNDRSISYWRIQGLRPDGVFVLSLKHTRTRLH